MVNRFQRLVEWMIIILFALCCIIMIAQIIGRSVFNYSITWSEEFSRYSFIWFTLLASGIALKRKGHMGFDLLVIKLSHRTQYYIHILNDILIGIFLVLFFIKGIEIMQGVGTTPSPSMNIPMYIVYFIMPLSALVMFVFILSSLWHTIRKGSIPSDKNEEKGDLAC